MIVHCQVYSHATYQLSTQCDRLIPIKKRNVQVKKYLIIKIFSVEL